jgi:glycosidase
LFIAFLLGCSSHSTKKVESDQEQVESTLLSKTIIPEWSKDATIYEVNLRQYSPEGTLAAFEKHLPRLKEMGVKILWMMPIHPISKVKRKGSLGSYYAVADYKDVNPEFGTLDDFKAFVEKAHVMGFKVILDWVANHTGWDNPWIFDHPEWFTQDSLGNIIPPNADWNDIADLNFDVPEMRLAMIDALQFWIVETDIDGYRCDVAWGVPVDFWNQARDALDPLKSIWMLAEDEEHKDFLMNAFNCNYSWSLHHQLNSIAKGEANVDVIKSYFAEVDSTYPMGSYMMQFTSNHDENSWQGTVGERMGEAAPTMATLTFMFPGMPLIYSGQEAGLNKRLLFFEKDEIDWSNLELQVLYKKLISIKKANKALWNGDAGGDIHFCKMTKENNLMAFSRSIASNKVLCVFNLSADTLSNTIDDETLSGVFRNAFTGGKKTIDIDERLTLAPWEYKIYIGD